MVQVEFLKISELIEQAIESATFELALQTKYK